MGILNNFTNAMGGGGGIGLLNSVTSLINSANERRTSIQNTERTNQANLNLAKYQYDQEKQMWNMANAYNSPSAQMQRYKDAGLNPNLIYGQGSPGNSPNVLPQYHAPNISYDYKPLEIPPIISQYQDYQIKSAQRDNLKAQKDNIEQRTANDAVTNALLLQRKYEGSIKNQWLPDWYQKRDMIQKGTIDKLNFGNILTKHQGDAQAIKNHYLGQTIRLQLATASALQKKILLQNIGLNQENEFGARDLQWYLPDKIKSYVDTVGGIGKMLFGRGRR